MNVAHVSGSCSGLDASASLSHSSVSFPKSLKKKLMMLQETLNLPPVDSETVNRLVLERFVNSLGGAGATGWRNSLVSILPPPGFVGVGDHVGLKAVDLLLWETDKI